MTRLYLIAAFALSACNTATGPHVTAAENRPASHDYTWPPPELVGRPCIGQGPGCYGGIFQPEPKPTKGEGK